MKSPLRYPGGKTRAIKILKNYIPKDCKEVCSPFFGGGSFEIYLANNSVNVHGYDIFKPLVSYWNSVKGGFPLKVEVQDLFDNMSKELFYSTQKNVLSEQNEYKQGAMFYMLNRASFSGSTLSGGMSPNWVRFNQRAVNDCANCYDLFHNGNPALVTVDLLSFENSIPKHKDCLIFADPPYYINQKLYGNKGDTHANFDHKLLANVLLQHGNFVLTYNDCHEIRELYKGCKFDIVNWAYGMNNSKKSNEVVITPKNTD